MEGAIIFGIFLVGIAIVGVGMYVRKMRRRNAIALFARKFGFTFSPGDVRGLLTSDLALFRKGDGRGTENIMWGDWKGAPFLAGDYWYYDESRDSDGGKSRTYHYFSVATAEVDGYLPGVTITRENVFSWVADRLGFDDIQFESEDFNRRFKVASRDRKFAFELIDAQMMHWLLSVDGRFCFEVGGSHLLCYSKRLKPNQLLMVIGFLKEFRDHVPRLVLTKYGPEAFGLPTHAYSHVPPPVGTPPPPPPPAAVPHGQGEPAGGTRP